MEAMTELCDLISLHPDLFADKLSWLCSRCPPPQSPRVTRSHLNAVTSLARLLSKSPSPSLSTARSALLNFISSLHPLAFRPSFWPHPFPLPAVSLFFSDLLRYLSLAADLSPAFSSDLAALLGDVVVSAVACGGDERDVARVFLSAVAGNCPAVSAADAGRLVRCLVKQVVGGEEGVCLSGSENLGSKGKVVEDGDVVDDGSSEISSVMNGGGGGEGSDLSKGFQGESVEGLERMEIAFRLVRGVVDRAGRMRGEELGVFYGVAAKQLKSLPGFLKVVVRRFFDVNFVYFF